MSKKQKIVPWEQQNSTSFSAVSSQVSFNNSSFLGRISLERKTNLSSQRKQIDKQKTAQLSKEQMNQPKNLKERKFIPQQSWPKEGGLLTLSQSYDEGYLHSRRRQKMAKTESQKQNSLSSTRNQAPAPQQSFDQQGNFYPIEESQQKQLRKHYKENISHRERSLLQNSIFSNTNEKKNVNQRLSQTLLIDNSFGMGSPALEQDYSPLDQSQMKIDPHTEPIQMNYLIRNRHEFTNQVIIQNSQQKSREQQKFIEQISFASHKEQMPKRQNKFNQPQSTLQMVNECLDDFREIYKQISIEQPPKSVKALGQAAIPIWKFYNRQLFGFVSLKNIPSFLQQLNNLLIEQKKEVSQNQSHGGNNTNIFLKGFELLIEVFQLSSNLQKEFSKQVLLIISNSELKNQILKSFILLVIKKSFKRFFLKNSRLIQLQTDPVLQSQRKLGHQLFLLPLVNILQSQDLQNLIQSSNWSQVVNIIKKNFFNF